MKNSFLLFFIALSAVLSAQKELSLDDVWGRGYSKFQTEYVYGLKSMNDGLFYTVLVNDFDKKTSMIVKKAYTGGRTPDVPLFSTEGKTFENGNPFYFNEYSFNSDETKILLETETEYIYRHSSKSDYYIYDIQKDELKKLTKGGEKQMHATSSPNGDKVAFVRDNNIFIIDLKSREETQVTFDGLYNHIINGSADWVYEEEFAFAKAFFWSPDGSQLAYYRFDESEVKEFNMAMYGDLYPSFYKFKYPKAGEKNSDVSIHVYNVMSKTSKKVNTGEELDQYIPRIKWTNTANHLLVYRMNRHQNKLELLDVTTNGDPRSTAYQGKVFYTETSDTYIEITDDIRFLEDGKRFIWTSDKSGYNHIYLIDFSGKSKQITNGKYVVTEFYGIDEKNNLFYQAAKKTPHQREVYKVSLDGKKEIKLTSHLGMNNADFSNKMKYFINYHSDANTPYLITLNQGSDGKELRVLKDNSQLKKTLEEYSFQSKEFFEFNTSESINLKGWMIKPKNFDETKKYPVYMFQYSGPNSQEVLDKYDGRDYLWHQLLSQNGYLVVCVDGRGTGARGVEFQKCTYQELGKYETMDQIETAKYLGGLSFVDKDNIGIQGWSYGGFMASLCMTKGADYFKAGIAVAPVTNWRFYDSIYTERYMRTPQENASGYDDNSPINHVDKLKGAYLLVHGSADDNVHYQNTMEMITELVNHNKQFDLFIYPNKNHGIYGGNTRLHLYTKMFNFCEENLK